ncbi:Ig domain-containing protein, partial [Paraburkholderia sediminicola]|nr:Ig domain-containing protein [Paraburkholderia sediminicola]
MSGASLRLPTGRRHQMVGPGWVRGHVPLTTRFTGGAHGATSNPENVLQAFRDSQMTHSGNVMNRYLLASLLFLAAFMAGCHGGGDDLSTPASPPAGLTYFQTPVAYPLGVEIAPNLPSSGGGPITLYSVSPALPVGLSLNPQTGIITGTPTAVTAPALYTVTGSNAAGSASAGVQIEVTATAIAPQSLRYLDESVVYVTGTPIMPNEPRSSGGEITQFSVSPV